MEGINLSLDQHAIRFTPDGKIAVIDAITALSDSSNARHIWRDLSATHPEILAFCDSYNFRKSESTPVANGEGWEIIQSLLFEYLVEESLVTSEHAW